MKFKKYISRYAYTPAMVALLLFVLINTKMSMAQNHLNSYRHIEPLKSMSELDYPFDVNYVQLLDDIELAYADEGQGVQTLIFIHGLGSYMKAWTKNIRGLKQHYRCIAVDLPGYGKSSKLPHSGKMTYYAEVIKALIDKLELKNVSLVGHSMGGQISMVAAINYPEAIQKLILTAPAGFEEFNKGQKQWFREVMTLDGVKLTNVEQIQTNLAYNFYNMPKDADFMATDRMAMRSANDFDAYCYAVVQSVSGMVDEPVLEMLDQISQPTLILFGENDNLIPNRFLNPGKTIEIAELGHSKIPNSTLIIVPKAGHFMQFEKPDTFNTAVIEFLK